VVQYGGYAPRDFNFSFAGTVTVAQALQQSLNMPAIAVLGKVGVNRLSSRLAQAGAALVLPKGEAPGLAMGLGGVGIRLADLTMLYAGLARLGAVEPLIEREGVLSSGPRRLLDPVAAWYIGNILLGAPPPENGPHGRIAFKTGTSYGFRDAWAVGFDGRMTIGIWVGRPDGAPVPGMVGRAAAAPILFDAFARSGLALMPLPPAPKGAVFAATSKLPPPLQRFSPSVAPGEVSEPPRIMHIHAPRSPREAILRKAHFNVFQYVPAPCRRADYRTDDSQYDVQDQAFASLVHQLAAYEPRNQTQHNPCQYRHNLFSLCGTLWRLPARFGFVLRFQRACFVGLYIDLFCELG